MVIKLVRWQYRYGWQEQVEMLIKLVRYIAVQI
jgi:hypothetical protein